MRQVQRRIDLQVFTRSAFLECHHRPIVMHGSDEPNEDIRKVDAAGGADSVAAASGVVLAKGRPAFISDGT